MEGRGQASPGMPTCPVSQCLMASAQLEACPRPLLHSQAEHGTPKLLRSRTSSEETKPTIPLCCHMMLAWQPVQDQLDTRMEAESGMLNVCCCRTLSGVDGDRRAERGKEAF